MIKTHPDLLRTYANNANETTMLMLTSNQRASKLNNNDF